MIKIKFNQPKHFNQKSNGTSPLHYAVMLGAIDIVRWFLRQPIGIDINSADDQGRTPLFICCEIGWRDITQLLFSHHTNCDVNKADSIGRTPLFAACEGGHTDVVVELLQQPLIDINYLSSESTALAAAGKQGYEEIISILLKRPEIDVNAMAEDSYTPILIATKSMYYPLDLNCMNGFL